MVYTHYASADSASFGDLGNDSQSGQMAASDKSRKYHDTRTRIELYRPGAEKHKAGLQ